MSFDLFVLSPTFDRDTAARFNALVRAGLPAGLSIDLEQVTSDSAFLTIDQAGEEWAELHIDRDATHDYPHPPANLADGWIEIHVPSRGHPMVFHTVAALAEVSGGWVFDPQGVADEVGLEGGADEAGLVRHGFYTPAFTRQLADLLAKKYTWN